MAEVHTGADSLLLWESEPAERLVDAHLLGNGRLGAAVFGALPDERIVINEDTLWSGSESFFLNPDTRALLPEARRLVFERKFAEAHRLVAERMLGGWGQAYEPLGTLHVAVSLESPAGSEFLQAHASRAAAGSTGARSTSTPPWLPSSTGRAGGCSGVNAS